MLQAVERTTAIGRRNYAMLLMASTYGLRGIEIVQMCLEDIEWNAEKLHIRVRRGGSPSVYPLTAAVADALVVYLKDGRPESRHREILSYATRTFPSNAYRRRTPHCQETPEGSRPRRARSWGTHVPLFLRPEAL